MSRKKYVSIYNLFPDRKSRRCLGCGKYFMSLHRSNRQCPSCTDKASAMVKGNGKRCFQVRETICLTSEDINSRLSITLARFGHGT